MTSQKPIFFPLLIVGILLLAAALISAYDARTIIEAEKDEEEIGRVLLSAQRWFADIQQVRIELLQSLLSGREEDRVSYEAGRYDAAKSLQRLQQVLTAHFPEALPQLRPLQDLRQTYFAELDKAIGMRNTGSGAADVQAVVSEQSRLLADQMRPFLFGLTDKVQGRREAINARVSRSILRGNDQLRADDGNHDCDSRRGLSLHDAPACNHSGAYRQTGKRSHA